MLANELKKAEGVEVNKTSFEPNEELEYPTEFTEEERRILESYHSCMSSHTLCDGTPHPLSEDDDGSTIFHAFKPGQE